MFSQRILSHNVSLALQFLFLICLTFGLYVVPDGDDPYIALFVIGLFYVYFLRSFFFPISIRSGIPVYTTIESLFLMFYLLLFIHPYQSHLLGIADLRINTFLTNTFASGANQALLATAIGFVAFHLGISSARRSRLFQRPAYSSSLEDDHYRGLSYIVLFMLAGFITIYEVAGLQASDEARYTKSASGGAIADGIYLIVTMLCIIAVARLVTVLSQRRTIELPVWISLCIVAYWSGRILLNGDRNSFFLIAIAAGGGIFTFVRRTSWVVLVVCVFVSLVLYKSVEVVRMSKDRSFSTMLEKVFEESSNKEASSSSSFSITTTTLRATFDITPNRLDYGYGRYKLIGFAGIIPLIRGYALGDQTSFTNTSEVLSYYMLGQNAGWSVGSNLLTDIYMDFGIIGIPIVIFLAGLFAGRIQRSAITQSHSTKTITMYLIVLSNFAELPRYTLDSPVRMLVWSYMLFWLYDLVMKQRHPRLSKRTRPPALVAPSYDVSIHSPRPSLLRPSSRPSASDQNKH